MFPLATVSHYIPCAFLSHFKRHCRFTFFLCSPSTGSMKEMPLSLRALSSFGFLTAHSCFSCLPCHAEPNFRPQIIRSGNCLDLCKRPPGPHISFRKFLIQQRGLLTLLMFPVPQCLQTEHLFSRFSPYLTRDDLENHFEGPVTRFGAMVENVIRFLQKTNQVVLPGTRILPSARMS